LRVFPFAFLLAVAVVAGPAPAAGGDAFPIRSPWPVAGGAAKLAPGAARLQVPKAWLDIQARREKRWRSFPDLVVHPGGEWSPQFGDRRGVRAPLESVRSSRAGQPVRAAAGPLVMKVALIRIEFNTDRGGGKSTGDGRFDLGNPGASAPAIDRPPHNRKFYQDHLEALRRYYDAQSYGSVDIQGEVWPRDTSNVISAYRVSDMADYGPWAFGSSIYPAAVKMFQDFLLAADTQSRALGDSIPWNDYSYVDPASGRKGYRILVVHAGSDLQSDVLQDSPEDIPTFTLGVADSDRVVFPGATKRCPPVAGDTLAEYCPIGSALFLPETINQDGYYGAINAVIAHECGHLLFGLSDLYDIVNGLPVCGYWSLMDTGNLAGAVIPQDSGEDIYAVGLLPPSIDPFQRFFVGDALTFPEVTYDGAPTQILDGERHPDMRAVTQSGDEFVLLENRAIAAGTTITLDQDPVSHVILGPKDPDKYEYDALLPTWPLDSPSYGKQAGGIVAWHIDTSVLTYSTSLRVNDDFGFNTNRRRLGVSVIEADGLADLGDLGSPLLFGSHRDPFYKSNNATLSDTTAPNLIPNVGTRPHVRLDFLDEPNDTMLFTAQRTWQLPGWPVVTEFPPGGPQLLAVDADGDTGDNALEVCWAGGDTTSADANGVFVLKKNGQGMFGPSALLASLPDRPRPLIAALPAPQGPIGAQGPSWLAISTYAAAGSGGQVWMIDASTANAGQAVAGWPPALPSLVSTPPMIVGENSSASVLVGCEDGHVYALALDGSVRARSRDALTGGIRGRLAAVQVENVAVGTDAVPPPVGTLSGWLVAAGAAGGKAAVWFFDPVAGPNARMPFVSGWPQSLASSAGFAPDFLWLDFDGAGSAGGNPSGCRAGLPELVAHDRNRMWAFCAEGRLLPGWGRALSDTLVAALGAGDPDGDGFPEVLTQTSDSKVAFVNLTGYPSPGWPRAGSNEGVLSENPELTAPSPAQRFPTSSPPLALDLNGDGRCEVVAPNTSGILAALDVNGHTPAGWPLATGSGAGGSAVAADLDRDGYLDLVAPDRFGTLFAYSLPVPALPATTQPWRMLGGDPGRTAALPSARMTPTPGAVAGPLIQGSLKAFPNPARKRPVSFAYQLSEPADVEFRILDASGHEVASFSRSGQRADNLAIWEPGDLPAGLYLARVRFRSSGREEVQVLSLGLIR
jgi:M6 family metalloprotease-like protein